MAEAPVDWHAIDGAPPPVRRYLRNALRDCPHRIAAAHFTQRGRLRTSGDSPRWTRFDAQHDVQPTRAEFTWNAVVRVLGPLHVRVVDRLLGGRGFGKVYALSVLRIASSKPCLEMNHGALHRFLAEAVWVPTALVPNPQLTWTVLDERRAAATLTTAAASVSLEFRFNDADEVVGIYTPARWGLFKGRFEQRAWEGHFSRYETLSGIRVPTRGDVGWYAGSTWQMVWDGEVLSAHYTPAPA